MVELTDEKLMAYVDGELDDLETEEVGNALLTNTKAQERINIFKESSTLLRKAYDAPFHEEVPQRLIDGINNYAAPLRLVDRIASWFQVVSWQPVHALAFSMLLLVGIGAGWFAADFSKPERIEYSSLFQGEDFSQGMETALSGVNFNIDDQRASVTPITTFQDQHGHYCRQYEVVRRGNGSSLSSYGVACRTEAGDWLTRVAFLPKPPDFSPGKMQDGYVPASDDELAATIFSNLMAEPPLTITQEEVVIRGGWGGKGEDKQ
ncbi:MAG: hypothetical protein U9Q61_10555 [Thermodesulfobacteriota bacterium]|nr:hypothetical protein [Thermodesulfobacteriota bacterium]